MYAIITPTFQPHFIYIQKYLKSFEKFLEDPEAVQFYFTVSSKEIREFQHIVNNFPSLNIKILCFEDILKHFVIKESSEELLNKYKKFSFQTLKKFYSILYVKERYSLILDSESMLIRKTCMADLFENFFNKPFISGSQINNRYLSDFTKAVNDNIDIVLQDKIPYFFIENFVWFYDKKILNDLFNSYGMPIKLVQQIYDNYEEGSFGREVGIFEIELYQAYVWLNRNKYGYKFINTTKYLKSILSLKQWNEFMKYHDKKYEGNCGLLERITELLSVLPADKIANWMKSNNYNIIRCDQTNIENFKLQKRFLQKINPNILAASQDHIWGINYTRQNKKRLIRESHSFRKLTECWNYFKIPFIIPARIIKWILQPIILLFYGIKNLFEVMTLFND